MTLDLTNKKFGRWTPIKRDVLNRKNWNCICECGVEKSVYGADLRGGKSLSCGCLRGEQVAERNKANATHGMFGTVEYAAWSQMIARCERPTDNSFKNYGARGLTVSTEWRAGFEAFLSDMGMRPLNHSLGRIDNDQGYSAENCRWETQKQQANNRRSSVKVSWRNEEKTLAEWSDVTGIHPDTLNQRIFKLHWTPEKAFTTDAQDYKIRGNAN